MARPFHITILGGGIAGLSAGFYAREAAIPFTIYEGGNRVGGNCFTLKSGNFLFDTGAHRFHDKDREITEDIRGLLGSELKPVSRPSFIFREGRLIRFPISPSDLVRNLGWNVSSRAAWALVRSRIFGKKKAPNFREYAVHSFGETVAGLFLLNYSRKLWGLPTERLSVDIGGARLRGLSLKAVLRDMFFDPKGASGHLEGTFYYPDLGIGRIPDRLAEACGMENVRLDSPVASIQHDGSRVNWIVLKGGERVRVDLLVNTLPLPRVLELLNPAPPAEILSSGKVLHFRDVLLVVFFLRKPSVTAAASIYFPDPRFVFTRLFEPKNRSGAMAPPDQTAIVVEIPSQKGEQIRARSERELVELAQEQLMEAGFFTNEEIAGSAFRYLNDAYPVLEVGADETARRVIRYLGSFANVKTIGRGGRFSYVHIHDLLRSGKGVVSELAGKTSSSS